MSGLIRFHRSDFQRYHVQYWSSLVITKAPSMARKVLVMLWHFYWNGLEHTSGQLNGIPFSNFSCVQCTIIAHVVIWSQTKFKPIHYNDVIMDAMTSQVTSLTIVYSAVYSGADQRKHQSSASLAFVREIQRWPLNFPYKWPVTRVVTRNLFPFDDVIMFQDFPRTWMVKCKHFCTSFLWHHTFIISFLVLQTASCFPWGMISTTWVSTDLRDDRKCKCIFKFPKRNPANKGQCVQMHNEKIWMTKIDSNLPILQSKLFNSES